MSFVCATENVAPANLQHRKLQALGQVQNLVLIDANTDTPIFSLTNGMVINTAALSTTNFNIQAITTSGTVGSVRFSYNGQTNYKTEVNPPYAFCGDGPSVGNYKPCAVLVAGQHTVTATPFSGSKANGDQGVSLQVTFTITNAIPTKAPMKSPTKSPVKAPMKSPTKSPAKTPTNAPVPAPTPAPVPAPKSAPVTSPTSSCNIAQVRSISIIEM
jgi:hypothetical protein